MSFLSRTRPNDCWLAGVLAIPQSGGWPDPDSARPKSIPITAGGIPIGQSTTTASRSTSQGRHNREPSLASLRSHSHPPTARLRCLVDCGPGKVDITRGGGGGGGVATSQQPTALSCDVRRRHSARCDRRAGRVTSHGRRRRRATGCRRPPGCSNCARIIRRGMQMRPHEDPAPLRNGSYRIVEVQHNWP